MPLLTAAVLVQMAAVCGVTPVPPARLVAHARVESGLQTTALHDNATGKSYFPDTVDDAVAIAKPLLAQGHRIDVGVMQVTDSNFAALGLTIETAFDPQRNVCAGQAVIAEAYRIERAVSCRYQTGKADCLTGYPEKIAAAMGRVEPLAPPPVAVTVVSRPPEGRPPAWNVYAVAQAERAAQHVLPTVKE